MGFTAHEVRTIGTGSCLMLLYFAAVGYTAWQRVRWCEWRQSLLRCMGSRCPFPSRLLAAVGIKSGKEDEHEDEDMERRIEHYVAECIAEQIVRNFRQLGAFLAFVFCSSVSLVILNMCMDVPRWNSPLDDTLTLVSCAMSLVMFVQPKSISHRTIPCWYSLLMATWCLWLWPAETPPNMMHRATCFLVLRLVSSVVVSRPLMVTCWQAVYLACSSYKMVVISQKVQSDVSLSMVVTSELGLSCILVLSAYLTTKSNHDKVYTDVKCATLKGGGVAMADLLDLMCDVVVELGADLQLTKHVPRFSALVTVDDTNRSMKGRQMQEFIPLAEDKQIFEEHLLSATCSSDAAGSPDMVPGVMHSKLRDALGNCISVELFCVKFKSCGETRFLIGIREEVDWGIAELSTFVDNKVTNQAKKKKATTATNRGTPPTAIGRPLDDAEAKSGNEASAASGAEAMHPSSSSAAAAAADPDHPITTKRARLWSLIRTMESWVHEEQDMCCSFHDSVSVAKEGVRMMEGFSCAQRFGSKGNMQCQACGILMTYKGGPATAGDGVGGRACKLCGCKQLRQVSPKCPPQQLPQLGDGPELGDESRKVNL